MRIRPVYDTIAITPVHIEEMEIPKKDEQGLGIAEMERKTLRLRFLVIAVGPGKFNPHSSTYVSPLVKPGDIIVLTDSDQNIREFWKEHEPLYANGVPLMFTDENAIQAVEEQ